MTADDSRPLSEGTVAGIRAVLERYERRSLTLAAAIAEIEALADEDRQSRAEPFCHSVQEMFQSPKPLVEASFARVPVTSTMSPGWEKL